MLECYEREVLLGPDLHFYHLEICNYYLRTQFLYYDVFCPSECCSGQASKFYWQILRFLVTKLQLEHEKVHINEK